MRLPVLFLLLICCLLGDKGRAASRNDDLWADFRKALGAGNFDQAEAICSEMLKENPKDQWALNARAVAYRSQKEFGKALRDLDEAIRLKPENMFYYNRGVVFHERGDDESALKDLNQAIGALPSKAPERPIYLVTRAHCYFNQEKLDLVFADLNRAIKLGSKDPDAFVLRGISHKIRHEYGLSMADYQKAMALNPEDPRPYDVAAYLLSVCPIHEYRDGARAVRYANKACELTKWADASYVQTLAVADAEAGDFDNAIKFEKWALEMDPKASNPDDLKSFERHEPVRDLNHSGQPFAVPPQDSVSIKIGEKLDVQADEDGEQLVHPRVGHKSSEEAGWLHLDFHREKEKRVLHLQHGFDRAVRVRCLARLTGWDAYFETDLVPVLPRTIGREIWSEEIDELVLFDFHFLSDTSKQSVASRY